MGEEEIMSIDLDRKKLLQEQRLEEIRRTPQPLEWITVHRPVNTRVPMDYFIYCALIPPNQIEEILSDTKISDNPEVFDGMPDALHCGLEDSEERVKYFRYGTANGLEPLIISRSFREIKTPYNEISEEFRHFHNLYHDRKTDKYTKIDDDTGNEETIAIVKPNEVKIRLKEIRQFLALKEMYLSILFEFNAYSTYSLQELGLNEKDPEFKRDGLICWRYDRLDTSPYHGFRSESRLRGRTLIKPLEKSKSGFGAFAKEPEYAQFIIAVAENGEEIRHTCDPTKLDHYGSNPEAPSDLTPVHFRKQVLDKYYRESSKYSVEDSIVSCPWWSMRIDNHHEDKVIVWLRELCFLPYTEQLYWQSYNIPPESGVSLTFWRRNFKGEWVSSDQPEHLFKQRYDYLQKESEKHLGWQLLRPLAPRDEHHLKGLRIPSTDEQRDFDELVLSLTKILIDSLNQKELKKLISLKQEQNLTLDQQESLKGTIDCLEIALSCSGVKGAEDHITFLRKLQSLRSSGSAHFKGSKYQKIAKNFDIEGQSLREVFAGILWTALDVLDYFIFLIRSSQINREIIEQNSIERGYAILDEMVGFADFDSTDGSADHDEVIYKLDSKS